MYLKFFVFVQMHGTRGKDKSTRKPREFGQEKLERDAKRKKTSAIQRQQIFLPRSTRKDDTVQLLQIFTSTITHVLIFLFR